MEKQIKTKLTAAIVTLLIGLSTVAYSSGLFHKLAQAIVAPTPPRIDAVIPDVGPTEGLETVKIVGSYFQENAVVTFDYIPVQVLNLEFEEITVVTPPHAAGSVDVTVTNPDSLSDTLENGYTYEEAPPEPPEEPGVCDGQGKGKGNARKVAVCHVPEGNVEMMHTICLPPPAIDAHMKKHEFDYMGSCEEEKPGNPKQSKK